MADITWDDVESHYPGMSAVGEDAHDNILAFVNAEALSATVFGGEDSAKYKLARIHYAAHLGELGLRGTGGAAGPVASKTIAASSLSVSYADAGASESALLATVAGSALYTLMRSSPRARVFIARGC